MPADLDSFVSRFHASRARLVAALTGGSSRVIPWLLTVPGASRTVLEATVPYAPEALVDWLGGRPEQFCSPATARAMAMAAYRRCVQWSPAQAGEATSHVGLGATCSLASDRPKRGPHRVHVATQTGEATRQYTLELAKGHRTRDAEEDLAARLALNLLAETAGLDERLSLPLVEREVLDEQRVVAPDSWRALFSGTVQAVAARDPTPSAAPEVVFPGSFHPWHEGHRRMADVAARRLGRPVTYELAVFNVDKLPLDFIEMESRLRQFAVETPVWFSRCATFVDKAAAFPGATFVVGLDTLARIADPRYYHGDPRACLAAIEQIASRGCRFLVFGRSDARGFQTLASSTLPAALAAICEGVPAEEFRLDISSTELRRASILAD